MGTMTNDDRWHDISGYYDGALDGVIFDRGECFYFKVADNWDVDGADRVYDVIKIDAIPSDNAPREVWEKLWATEIDPDQVVRIITETQLREYPDKPGGWVETIRNRNEKRAGK